jgi:hypothetical protein
MKRAPLVVAATALCLLAAAAPASAAKPVKPGGSVVVDTWISGASGRVGDGVINGNAQGEILDSPAHAPATLVFDVGATVSGGSATVTFKGGGGSPDFQVQYLSPSGSDITMSVAGRGYTVRKVADGGTATIRMVVRVMPSAAGHAGNLAVRANTDMVSAFITAS